MKEDSLIVIESINPVALFTEDGGIDALLKAVEKQALSIEADPETASGRSKMASMGHKVARSKTLLDGLGKDLVADWKTKAKKVDAQRKHARDFLDNLKARVIKPIGS